VSFGGSTTRCDHWASEWITAQIDQENARNFATRKGGRSATCPSIRTAGGPATERPDAVRVLRSTTCPTHQIAWSSGYRYTGRTLTRKTSRGSTLVTKVKHQRDTHFAQANLDNCVNALFALFIAVLHCRKAEKSTLSLEPLPILLGREREPGQLLLETDYVVADFT
jgi:hypothetical protein